MKTCELDKIFDGGEEDGLQHFDLSKAKKPIWNSNAST